MTPMNSVRSHAAVAAEVIESAVEARVDTGLASTALVSTAEADTAAVGNEPDEEQRPRPSC